MLLGRQRRHKEFKGSSGRRGGFKASLLPNVAFLKPEENLQKSAKIARKAPGRWPKDMLLGCQGRHEGFKGSSGRRGGLRAAYCLTLLSETRRKSPGKRPAGGQRTCRLAAKGAMKGLEAAQGAGGV